MKLLRNKRGDMSIIAVALAIFMIILFLGIMEYMRVSSIAETTKTALTSAIGAVVVENYDNTYSSMREGFAGGQVKASEDAAWEESLDYGDIYERLDDLLGLTVITSDKMVKKDPSGNTEVILSNLEVEILNTDNVGEKGDAIAIKGTMDVEIPWHIGGFDNLPSIKFKLGSYSRYQAKM